MAKRIDEDKLKAIISREIADAKLFYRTDIEKDQRRALNYYEGRMTDTPSEEGWSSVVSRDVSDVIGWVLPGIVRVFTASDRIVDYQPMEPGDEEFTEQASDTINYDFWVTNPGYRILWDATHDSLLLGDGIVKTWWDDTKCYKTSVHSGLTAEQIAMLTENEDVEIVEQTEGEGYEDYVEGEPMAGPDGQMMPGEPQLVNIPTYDVKIKRVTSYGTLRFKAIERGNFFIDRDATTIEEARFCSQRDPRVTRSELLRMGFDKEKVQSIPRYDGSPDSNQDELTRDDTEPGLVDAPDEATEFVELHESYLQMDVNGDGIAETIRAYYAGNGGAGVLLEWEECDEEKPFDQIPCTPVPHRFSSDSLAGEVMDIQQIKTVLLRQGLNNTYQVNVPRMQIESDGVENMDEVINPTIGGVIIRKTGTLPIEPFVIPSILPNVLEATAAMDRIIEWRTGISRSTAALDPEALQNQTATASQLQHDSAYSQIELIARNQSELGWKKVFSKALRLTVKHQDKQRTIRLRDEWVNVDPRHWNSEMDAVVNTGLGTGSRDRDLMMLQQVSMQQEKLALAMQQTGMSELAIDMLDKIVKTSVKGAEAAGLRNAADYFPDLTEEVLTGLKEQAKAAQGQEDPKIALEREKSEADMQMKQAEMQMKAQMAQQAAQLDMQKAQASNELEKQKMQMEFALKREQLVAELNLKREQLNAELQMAQQQWQAEFQLQREQAAAGIHIQAKTAEAKAKSSNVRAGGKPG
jgi:hypothetical protein